MFNSVSPAEGEPISGLSAGWLWAARCFALIYTIALGGGYLADDPVGALFSFGPRLSLSLVLLFCLFRSGKNSLAFALGLGAATGFIALFGVASTESLRYSPNPLFISLVTGGPLNAPPFAQMMNQPNSPFVTLGLLLFWFFSVCSAMLGLSSVVTYKKIAHEAKGTGKLRLAFGAGIGCPLVVPLTFSTGLSLAGAFTSEPSLPRRHAPDPLGSSLTTVFF
jgi:hypothetical protein